MARRKQLATRSRTNRNAKNRGKYTEGAVAQFFDDGVVWPGDDGDVVLGHPRNPRKRIEVKHCQGLTGLSKLRNWLDQVHGYVRDQWPTGTRWVLVFTGGKSYRGPAKSGKYAVIPLEEYRRLDELDKQHGTPDS